MKGGIRWRGGPCRAVHAGASTRRDALARPVVAALLAMGLAMGLAPGEGAAQSAGGAPTSGAGVFDGGIPVLCYHGFADEDHAGVGELTESYERFGEMLHFLAEHGFETVLPDEVRAGPVPDRPVIITFDDGVRSQMRAAEMMERHGFRGVFFVIPARLETGNERYMTAEDARRLARAGHRVAPHGYAHRSMTSSGDETAASLVRSRPLLEDALGRDYPLDDFAFPFGHYGDAIADAAAERFAFLHTVNPGYWDGADPLIPRMLLARSVPLHFYTDYLLGAGDDQPAARMIEADGGTRDTIRFRISGLPPVGEWGVLTIADDRSGRMYRIHALGEGARLAGDTLTLDLKAHIERHYPADRRAISFALVSRAGGELRHLSPGYLVWLEEPTGWRADR